ncbi:MAG TPA: PDZ domain-containing protein, partial [Gemmataceae bacterium]|nr:PDZ domain-containing protein [Gemmataceae bacterium]
MFGRIVLATLVTAFCSLSASAGDSPLGFAVGERKDGGVFVTGVNKGSVASIMGLRVDDKIVSIAAGDGLARPVQRLADVKDLTDGKSGRYTIEVSKDERPRTPIKGVIG